ncbi:uncharacterized protein RJT20DRAFT_124804 [Scheffersomyces xylosifermentans]|uniref:uncharacterized protein n=1 Tax=Scheffersomyces xylosifermentans TaxID=1304137 RepID=UPI00315C5CD8
MSSSQFDSEGSPTPGLPPIVEKVKPINTIYVNNLNDKVSLKKLKASLDEIFQKHGKIIQLTAHKNLKMKGQAFITYETESEATAALKNLQKRVLFNKPIHIEYAKTYSDNYYNEIAKDTKAIEKRKDVKKAKEESKKRALEEEKRRPTKKVKLDDWKKLPPNKILLLQNLDDDVDQEVITTVFEEFSGFINARFVKVRHLSFVEFENEKASTECLSKLKEPVLKEKLGENVIFTYAKK